MHQPTRATTKSNTGVDLDRVFAHLMARHQQVEQRLAALYQRHHLDSEQELQSLKRRASRQVQRQLQLAAELAAEFERPDTSWEELCRPTTDELLARFRGHLIRV